MSYAQIYANCIHKEEHSLNRDTGKTTFQKGHDEQSVFKVNHEETVVEHTIGKRTIKYNVTEKHFDKEQKKYRLYTRLSSGEQYVFTFYIGENKVIVLHAINAHKGTAYIYYVDKWWTDAKQ